MPGKRLCLLSARNLGDAVIHADFLKALIKCGYAESYLVWTFEQAAFLFDGLPGCTVVTSDFPSGATTRRFVRGGWLGWSVALRRVRRWSPTHTLELVSDFRERASARLTGAPSHLHIGWKSGHPFRRHNWISPVQWGTTHDAPASQVSIYETYERLFRKLCPDGSPPFRARRTQPTLDRLGAPLQIALHPFASIECKQWPLDHWLRLMANLWELDERTRFLIIGTPSDSAVCERLARARPTNCDILMVPLPQLSRHLERADLLVGLDSFSVHLGTSLGVPTVMLVGPNDPRIFAPSAATIVSHPGHCRFQPCGGKPKCEGTDFRFVCMTAITPDEVLAASTLITGTVRGQS